MSPEHRLKIGEGKYHYSNKNGGEINQFQYRTFFIAITVIYTSGLCDSAVTHFIYIW